MPWVILAVGAVVVAAIHAFLFWWVRGPGRDPKYAREPGEPSALPGGKRPWERAFGFVYASPVWVFAALKVVGDVRVEAAAFWALAVFVGGQLILFGAVLALWAVRVFLQHGHAARTE